MIGEHEFLNPKYHILITFLSYIKYFGPSAKGKFEVLNEKIYSDFDEDFAFINLQRGFWPCVLIRACAFINFQKIFRPVCLFRSVCLLGTRKYSVIAESMTRM